MLQRSPGPVSVGALSIAGVVSVVALAGILSVVGLVAGVVLLVATLGRALHRAEGIGGAVGGLPGTWPSP